MSQIRRVIAAAALDLVPVLTRHGFARHRASGHFVRSVGDVVHLVSLVGGGWSGGTFSVAVDAWAPALSEGRSLTVAEVAKQRWTGGLLSPWRVDTGNWGWPIDGDEQIAEDLRAIARHVEQVALPWFGQLDDAAAVLAVAARRDPSVDIVNQLRALGDRRLVEHLKALGFRHEGPPLDHFVRERGPYMQLLAVEAVGGGVQANVWVHVATRWTAEAVYGSARESHEPWLPVNGGLLGSEGLDAGAMAWLVQGPEAVSGTVPALLAAIEAHALPWFDAVSAREPFLRSLRSDRLPVDRRTRLLELLRRRLPA